MSKLKRLTFIIDELGMEEARKAIQVSAVKMETLLNETAPVGKSTGIRIDKEYNSLMKDRKRPIPKDEESEDIQAGQRKMGIKNNNAGPRQVTDTYLW